MVHAFQAGLGEGVTRFFPYPILTAIRFGVNHRMNIQRAAAPPEFRFRRRKRAAASPAAHPVRLVSLFTR